MTEENHSKHLLEDRLKVVRPVIASTGDLIRALEVGRKKSDQFSVCTYTEGIVTETVIELTSCLMALVYDSKD